MVTPQGSWPGFIIPEHACTKKSIQQDLSHIRAIGTFLEPLPVPYDVLANAYGQKLVYFLGILGVVLSYVWYLIVCSNSNSSGFKCIPTDWCCPCVLDCNNDQFNSGS